MTFPQLVNYIETYCSDTFGAESSEITHDEAIEVAEHIIQEMVNKHIDGVMIDCYLNDIRENKVYENDTRPTTT